MAEILLIPPTYLAKVLNFLAIHILVRLRKLNFLFPVIEEERSALCQEP